MDIELPNELKKYFWGDDLDDLNWAEHKNYIIQTFLNSGGDDAIGWLLNNVGKNEIRKIVPTLKLNPKSKNFWQIYLS